MSLSSLKNQLSRLQAEKQNCETRRADEIVKRDMAKKRSDAVKPIKNNLERDFDNNCRTVNNLADQMKSDVTSGIKGIRNALILESTIAADKELFPDVDRKLSDAIANINQEYENLQDFYEERKEEIRLLDNRISSLNWEIIRVKKEIAAEEARLEAEKLKEKLSEVVGKIF